MNLCRPFTACDHILINNNKYLYLNDDRPTICDNTRKGYSEEICFVAQPIPNMINNTKLKIVTVPLMMSDEWKIISTNPHWLPEIRKMEKRYSYNFVGQCSYQGRSKLGELNQTLRDYDFESTTPIWDLNPKQKNLKLMAFIERMAKSRFVFAPRGEGSSSFRAYQAMSVGAVPIIMDSVSLPFDDEVDWDTISIRGSLSNIEQLISIASAMSSAGYDQMRQNAIAFWDNYCRHDQLYDKLVKIVGGIKSE